MAAPSGIVVTGLTELRAALRKAEAAMPRDLTKALKAAGEPILQEASALSPRRPGSGRLAASYRTRVRGTTGVITSTAPYGAGAEWGTHGKWKGFARYGARGSRFAGRAVDDRADETMALIYDGLTNIVRIYGWAY